MNTFLFPIYLLQEQSILMVSDKIYSVLTILLIVFAALIAYLYVTQKKVGKLEAQLKKWEESENQ